jgi:hypothetical protein
MHLLYNLILKRMQDRSFILKKIINDDFFLWRSMDAFSITNYVKKTNIVTQCMRL